MYDTNRKRIGCGCSVIAIFFIIVLLISIPACSSYYSTKTYTATVTDKTVKNYSDDSKYLVFTKLDNGQTKVFCIDDSLIKMRFNSSDVYAEIQTGKTYTFEVIGWRLEFFSEYENIMNYSEVS